VYDQPAMVRSREVKGETAKWRKRSKTKSGGENGVIVRMYDKAAELSDRIVGYVNEACDSSGVR
jgi:hypothetical protein